MIEMETPETYVTVSQSLKIYCAIASKFANALTEEDDTCSGRWRNKGATSGNWKVLKDRKFSSVMKQEAKVVDTLGGPARELQCDIGMALL